MNKDVWDDLAETPLQQVKPARGRFGSSAVAPILLKFYGAKEIDLMREKRVDDRMMFGINPYYLALVRGEEYLNADGKILLPAMPPSLPLKALVVPIMSEADDMSGELDPSNQNSYSPDALKGKLLHKYDEIALAYSAVACSAHCRYCYRLDIFNGTTGKGLVKAEDLKKYIVNYNGNLKKCKCDTSAEYSDRYPIREVLLSGGDPLILSNKNLYRYLAAAAEAGVHIVRIGTKEFAFRPERIDPSLVQMLELFNRNFPEVHIIFVVHFTHPDEFLQRDAKNKYEINSAGYLRWLDPVQSAVDNVGRLSFVSLENQTPIISGVNDNVHSLKMLQEELRRKNIKSKYLFQCRNIEGHKSFAVPVERAWMLHNEAQKGLSDTARSRFAMSTESGKLEIVGIIRPNGSQFSDILSGHNELVIMKVYRSPYGAKTQGAIIIARSNPEALWFSDYEDRILFDGRKEENFSIERSSFLN